MRIVGVYVGYRATGPAGSIGFGVPFAVKEFPTKRVVLHERGSGLWPPSWPPPNSKKKPDSKKSSPIKLLILIGEIQEKLRYIKR